MKTFFSALFLSFFVHVAFACGPELPNVNYRMLESSTAGPSKVYAAFALRIDDMLPSYSEFPARTAMDENIDEWRAKFCSMPDTGDVKQLVYDTDIESLTNLLEIAQSKGSITGDLSNNMLAQNLVTQGCNEAVAYLIFAHQCEPHVMGDQHPWDDNDYKQDTAAMRQLIKNGLGTIPNVKSQWVRLRYVFQCVRLAHYLEDYSLTVRMYERLMPRVDKRVESCIRYWTLGHYAGALLKLERFEEAAAAYADVFSNCQGKRYEAWQSFYIPNDKVWRGALARCTKVNQASMYAMRALMPDSRPINDIDSIYALAPDHPVLDIVMMKELQRLEQLRLGRGFVSPWNAEENAFYKNAVTAEDKTLDAFQVKVTKLLQKGGLRSPELWRYAKAYAAFLQGDYLTAEKESGALRPLVVSASKKRDGTIPGRWDGLIRQLDLLDVQLDLQKVNFNNPEHLQTLARIGQSHPLLEYFPDLKRYANDALCTQLYKAKRPGMALVVKYGIEELYYNPDQKIIGELLGNVKNLNVDPIDQIFLPDNARDLLYEIQGAYLLSRGQFGAAANLMGNIRKSYWTEDKARFNPFIDTLEVCHDCLYPNLDNEKLNRLQVAILLDTLQQRVMTKPNSSPKDYYLLGLACHNMSYFGREWAVADFFRSGVTWDQLKDGELANDGFMQYLGNLENTEVLPKLAKSFLETASSMYTNPEMKARATFRAAMVEQDLFFNKSGYTYYTNFVPSLKSDDRKNFMMLKQQNELNKTATYQQILRSCLYFRMYAAK